MKQKKKTTEKYLRVLQELYGKTLTPTYMSLRDIEKSWNLTHLFGSEVLKGGLVKFTGEKDGYTRQYVWNTIHPNYKMAEELRKRIAKRNKERMENCKIATKPKTKKETPTKHNLSLPEVKQKVEPKNIEKKKVSILWGLIKYETVTN